LLNLICIIFKFWMRFSLTNALISLHFTIVLTDFWRIDTQYLNKLEIFLQFRNTPLFTNPTLTNINIHFLSLILKIAVFTEIWAREVTLIYFRDKCIFLNFLDSKHISVSLLRWFQQYSRLSNDTESGKIISSFIVGSCVFNNTLFYRHQVADWSH
jgi:hypothetical protein